MDRPDIVYRVHIGSRMDAYGQARYCVSGPYRVVWTRMDRPYIVYRVHMGPHSQPTRQSYKTDHYTCSTQSTYHGLNAALRAHIPATMPHHRPCVMGLRHSLLAMPCPAPHTLTSCASLFLVRLLPFAPLI